MKYVALSAFRLNSAVKPKEVVVELKKLGRFTPKDVVESARKPSSPLHKYFEWDDSTAAEAYRLSQARNLILSVGFETEVGVTRQYESVVLDSQRMYVPVNEIAESPDLVDQVLKSAMNELLYWKQKHQRHEHLFGRVFGEIDVAEETLRRRNEKNKKGRSSGRGEVHNPANQKARGRRNNSGNESFARE